MSVRVSESYVTRNGHRRTVSAGLGTWLLAILAYCTARGLIGFFVILPAALMLGCLLAELWVCAAIVLFTVTGAVAVIAVARHEAKAADLTFTRLRWGLVIVGLRGATP
ncbi:MAG TPA: hypothetical protein VGH54_21740 [Mycobacterium sp.]|uniref:hypothetical protein n=1 Tax=Mycobacterium sp. TaxID=1785 RepID=UPI002F3EC266